MKILIIGGVAGGASCAARLRRLDEKAEIIILERGEYVSFANCGLPYYIGGKIIDRSDLTLQTPESFKKRFNMGYGNISPKNCFIGGQRTNCKMNKVVLQMYSENKKIDIYFLETKNYKMVEEDLLLSIETPYNVKNNRW
jgi:NADPH-dependent 2,4-dienoyl-CoA reductase/sulfur reductase-like enzyme